MKKADADSKVERMQNHPGANMEPRDFERITAALLVARCARCHNGKARS
jgi:hypothetical protein